MLSSQNNQVHTYYNLRNRDLNKIAKFNKAMKSYKIVILIISSCIFLQCYGKGDQKEEHGSQISDSERFAHDCRQSSFKRNPFRKSVAVSLCYTKLGAFFKILYLQKYLHFPIRTM